jgi:endonuclease-3
MANIATVQPSKAELIRKATIIQVLKNTYPDAKIVLRYRTPWELLVAVVLSAQCTDVVVNKVTAYLFTKYKSPEDYVRAEPHEFEQDIKPTGFFRSKAKNILASAKIVVEKYRGKVPDTMEELTALPGIARKSANIILSNAYGKIEGIAVDTHVLRLSQRLRLIDLDRIGGKHEIEFLRSGTSVVDYKKDADPVKVERELMGLVARSDWFLFTYLLIDHGRAICKAKNPDCGTCTVRAFCPSSRV